MPDALAGEGAAARHDPESDPVYIADPLADLLLSIGAVVILVVIAIFPTVTPNRAYDHSASVSHTLPKHFIFRFNGRDIDPWIATERGLVVGGASPRLVPADRIFFDESLVAALQRMRSAGDIVLLLIEPNGFETAFQLEVVISRHGPQQMHQIRLGSACNFARSEPIVLDCGDLGRQSGAPRP